MPPLTPSSPEGRNLDVLLEPFEFLFFRWGFLVALMVGAMCGALGVYIVLQGMSYVGHGLAHAVFGGAVVAFLAQWNFYVGAGLWGIVSALLINALSRRPEIKADAAIGIITTASFAFGVALISRSRSYTPSIEAMLFGNILGVTTSDLRIVAATFLAVAVLILLFYKPLLFYTFDQEVARVHGVPTPRLSVLFAFLLAGAIITSMQVLGVTLISAVLIIPATSARFLTAHFGRMMLLSTLTGALSAGAGIYLSYYVNIASGAAIILLQAGLFLAVLAYTSWRRRPARAL